MNIKINYMYRDASNYKLGGEVVLTNTTHASIEKIETAIRKNLIDDEYFIPEQWEVPRLEFDDYNEDLDHDYHEFESVEETTDPPTEDRDITALQLSN